MKIVCMAVPARAGIVDYLRKHIPGLEVVWDKKRYAPDTWMRSLEQIDNAVGGAIIEDDIVLTKGFYEKIQQEVQKRPKDFIQFFTRRKEDVASGSRYKTGRSFTNSPCVYYPPGSAAELIQYAENHPRWTTDPTGYDLLISDYLTEKRLKYWIVVPNIVDHLSLVSAIDPRRSKNRKSTTFCNPELEGLPSADLPKR